MTGTFNSFPVILLTIKPFSVSSVGLEGQITTAAGCAFYGLGQQITSNDNQLCMLKISIATGNTPCKLKDAQGNGRLLHLYLIYQRPTN